MQQKNVSCTILSSEVLLTPKRERLLNQHIFFSVADKGDVDNISFVVNERERIGNLILGSRQI